MEEYMLAASPSWYCSRVSDCSSQGVFVFGAKNSVYFLDASHKPPCYIGHVKAHIDRVVSLSLCKHDADRLMCCTAGEDGHVKIWDLLEKSVQHEHTHHKVNL